MSGPRTASPRLSWCAAIALVASGVVLAPSAPAATAPVAAARAVPAWDEPAVPTRPASARYVVELYRGTLGREPDPTGSAHWGERIDSGTPRAAVARRFALSDEKARPLVGALYDDFDRPADAGGLDYWTARVRSGLDLEDLGGALFGTPEYASRHPGGAAAVIEGFYEDILGRTGSEEEVAFWTDVVSDGDGFAMVAERFFRSPERAGPVVDRAYDTVLLRPADAGGRAYWLGRISRGTSGELDLIARFAGSEEAWTLGCDPLVGRSCLLPWPNDYFTTTDDTTDTGRRLDLKPTFFTANSSGKAFDPREWNRNDGFSPGSPILAQVPGIDLEETGAAPITDMARSLDADAPIVVVEASTGTRWPVWVELDANATSAADQALIIRPAKNFRDGERYVVALRDVRNASGALISPTADFLTYRDDLPSDSARVNQRRSAMEQSFTDLEAAGVNRADLHLAWDFTVASTRNLAERLVHMRDDALSRLGSASPDFSVTSNEYNAEQGIRRVEGTFQVPLYLTGTGAPGSRITQGPDSLPVANGSFTARFVCIVPDEALATPGRPVVYGHGLLGSPGEVGSGSQRAMAREHGTVMCASPWIGMAAEDIPNTVKILNDLSFFSELADRSQQGILNGLLLARLMINADGLVSHPAFQAPGGEGVIDRTAVYYDGNSQGGIIGGALMAVSTDITRGVLGVPAMNYSTLLQRSVDFEQFRQIFDPAYPNQLDRVIGISLVQVLWDRGEANGYANHMTTDPLPGTPEHRVLLHVAFGDHQVANVAADVEARTIGAATNATPLAPGRSPDVEPLWAIDRIDSYPYAGSATIYWDSGTDAPPTQNIPNRAGEDPHGDPRNDPDGRLQKSNFLTPAGVVTDVCAGAPCIADRE